MEIRRKQIILLLYVPVVIFLLWLPEQIQMKGLGFFSAALSSVLGPMLLLFGSLSGAVERLQRPRIAKGQYKNADRILKSALVYALSAGGLLTGLTYLVCSLWMEKVLLVPYGVLALRFFAPVILLFALAAVFKGYFQGQGNGLPTVCFEALSIVFGIVFAILFGARLTAYGQKAAALLANSDFTAMYGAAGTVLGFALGYFIGLVFLFVVYLISEKNRRRKAAAGMKKTEGYKDAFRLLFLSVLPYVPVGLLAVLPFPVGILLFQRARENIYESVQAYGAFVENYVLWVILALLPILAGSCGMVGRSCLHIRREEYRHGKEAVQRMTQWLICLSAFVAAVYMVFGGEISDAGLCSGGLCVIFLAVGICFLQVLWDCGKLKEVYASMGCGCGLALIVLAVGMKSAADPVVVLSCGLIAQGFGTLLVACVLLLRLYRFSLNGVRCVAFPVLSAAVSGLVMLLLKKLLLDGVGAGACSWICAVIGFMVHLVLILVLRCCRKSDLKDMPGGKLLLLFGKLIHFM